MNTDDTKEALQVIEAGLVAVLAGVRMLGAAPDYYYDMIAGGGRLGG